MIVDVSYLLVCSMVSQTTITCTQASSRVPCSLWNSNLNSHFNKNAEDFLRRLDPRSANGAKSDNALQKDTMAITKKKGPFRSCLVSTLQPRQFNEHENNNGRDRKQNDDKSISELSTVKMSNISPTLRVSLLFVGLTFDLRSGRKCQSCLFSSSPPSSEYPYPGH